MKPIFHLNEPNLVAKLSDGVTFRVDGWIVALEEIDNIRVTNLDTNGRPLLELQCSDYPEVIAELGYEGPKCARRFIGECDFQRLAHLDAVEISYDSQQQTYSFIAPVCDGPVHSIGNKPRKLQNLLSHLRCPSCHSDQLSRNDNTLTCNSCHSRYGFVPKQIDFIDEALRKSSNIIDTENVSANGYDGKVIDIINRNRNNLVLDCGAGCRQVYYDNVVNFEIVPYESTDVLGVGESLPFKDDTFDAILSLAVLEHVKDPFTCSKEIQRVLKPGGTLYCQIPFLAPFHAYPHHYYNMSQMGMRNLFEEQMDIESLDVMDLGQPFQLLYWILFLYTAGLPEDVQASFIKRPVSDFLRSPLHQVAEDYTLALSDQMKHDLACINHMVATKKKPDERSS